MIDWLIDWLIDWSKSGIDNNHFLTSILYLYIMSTGYISLYIIFIMLITTIRQICSQVEPQKHTKLHPWLQPCEITTDPGISTYLLVLGVPVTMDATRCHRFYLYLHGLFSLLNHLIMHVFRILHSPCYAWHATWHIDSCTIAPNRLLRPSSKG